ncbi:hypothetical protein HHI36_019871 [Cryptolaemus montrouzieri]|uniref:Uncharacterized protein n=1 Tax=Cryptolaemus montrouzieri TaxID=559131 RepID=A0ABD2N8M1_9CUCU
MNMKLTPVYQTFLNTSDLKIFTIRHWDQGKKIGSKTFHVTHFEREVSESSDEEPESTVEDLPANPPIQPVSIFRQSWSERREHLFNFLDKLPKTESHYCPANTKRLYLQCDIASME